jgi:hypothetical protein
VPYQTLVANANFRYWCVSDQLVGGGSQHRNRLCECSELAAPDSTLLPVVLAEWPRLSSRIGRTACDGQGIRKLAGWKSILRAKHLFGRSGITTINVTAFNHPWQSITRVSGVGKYRYNEPDIASYGKIMGRGERMALIWISNRQQLWLAVWFLHTSLASSFAK